MMKKPIAVLLTALLAASMVSSVAEAGKKKKKKKKKVVTQTVEGFVELPAPFPQDTSKCYAGLHRRLTIVTEENQSAVSNNGLVGFHFDVDKKTWNQPFVLEVAESASDDADFDIYFYSEFGTTEQVATDPLAAGDPYSFEYTTRQSGGETGTVPELMTKAIVCLYGGDQSATGYDAHFTYVAGGGAKKKK